MKEKTCRWASAKASISAQMSKAAIQVENWRSVKPASLTHAQESRWKSVRSWKPKDTNGPTAARLSIDCLLPFVLTSACR